MRTRAFVLATAVFLGGAVASSAETAVPPVEPQASCHEQPAGDVAQAARPRYAVTRAQYEVPDVTLYDASGGAVPLRRLLGGQRPVALNFVFTTCTTICPVMTATFAQLRRELGESAAGLQRVSISIDPDYDRPAVLKEYAARFKADQDWTFLTGSGRDVEQVLRAFGAYAGSKMNHRPLTLLKSPAEPSWVRIDGLASGGDLAHEIQDRLLD